MTMAQGGGRWGVWEAGERWEWAVLARCVPRVSLGIQLPPTVLSLPCQSINIKNQDIEETGPVLNNEARNWTSDAVEPQEGRADNRQRGI